MLGQIDPTAPVISALVLPLQWLSESGRGKGRVENGELALERNGAFLRPKRIRFKFA